MEDNASLSPLFVIAIAVAAVTVFVAFWCGIVALIAMVSGWSALARQYPAPEGHGGSSWGFESARMRMNSSYSGCLSIHATRDGLYLAVMPFFRFRHPPLLIPWREVAIEGRSTYSVELRLGPAPGTPLRISTSLAERLRIAAGPMWPGLRQPSSFS